MTDDGEDTNDLVSGKSSPQDPTTSSQTETETDSGVSVSQSNSLGSALGDFNFRQYADQREVTRLGIGEYAVTDDTERLLGAYGLGSCVVVALYHPPTKTAAMGHMMLPTRATSFDSPDERAKYVDTGTNVIISEMRRKRGNIIGVVGKLVGGSEMYKTESGLHRNIGRRNVIAAREALEGAGIEVVGEDVGGTTGRTVIFDVESGDVRVSVSGGDETTL